MKRREDGRKPRYIAPSRCCWDARTMVNNHGMRHHYYTPLPPLSYSPGETLEPSVSAHHSMATVRFITRRGGFEQVCSKHRHGIGANDTFVYSRSAPPAATTYAEYSTAIASGSISLPTVLCRKSTQRVSTQLLHHVHTNSGRAVSFSRRVNIRTNMSRPLLHTPPRPKPPPARPAMTPVVHDQTQ